MAGIRTRAERREDLKSRFFFDCECVLCEIEKEGPVINYERVLQVKSSLFNAPIFASDQLCLAKCISLDMRKMFCKYDERITNLYDKTLEKLVVTLQGPHAFMVNVTKVKEFAKEVKENLRITYGIDHKDYKYFVEELAPRLRAAK